MAKLAFQILAGTEMAPSLPGFLVSFGTFQWLYFCLCLFAVCVATIVIVSLLTAPPAGKLDGLTYATTAAAAREETRRSWNAWDVVHTAIILAIIAAVYIYFRG